MNMCRSASSWKIAFFSGLLIATLSSCAGSKSTPEDNRVEAFNDLRTEITEVVVAQDRQHQALQNVDELEQLFSKSQDILEMQRANLRALNQNYDATQEQYDALLDETAALLKKQQVSVMAVRANMAALLTDDEWAALEKRRSKAITKAFNSLNPS